ncbi:MAG: peptide ABC transporter permease [Robiginitomaculum sp.]|nr:MAG: peptide ABC transporter permease [Robiginitomaculum sp.]
MAFPGWTTLKLATVSLIEHPLRTLLTSLGIIIGVAAVYSMLAIGEGSRREILERMNGIDARSMSVYPDWSRRGRASKRRPWRPFSERDLEDIRLIPGVFAATGSLSKEVPVVNEKSDWSAQMQGIDLDYMRANDLVLVAGEPITASDIERREPVVVIGQTVVRTLFRGQDPVGTRIKLNNIPFTVKGVLGEINSEGFSNRDRDNIMLVPRTTARNRIIGGNYLVRDHISGLEIVAENQDDMTRIEREVGDILRLSRGLKPGEAPDYRIFNFSANRQAAAKSKRTLSLLLAAMGAVSLLVGGVGVMNIMLVSVTERTREIGLRMALGARQSDILWQFLTEALLLSIFGGLAGLGLGYAMSRFSLSMDDITMVFSLDIAMFAFGSALVIGVVFGFLPARRAAGLNPIEALRHE